MNPKTLEKTKYKLEINVYRKNELKEIKLCIV